MRKMLCLSVLVVALAACNRQTVSGLQVATTIKDSTTIVERWRVDTFTTPSDTVKMVIKLNCDSAGKVAPLELSQKSSRAEAKAILTPDGVLNLVFDCKELQQKINVADSIISYYKSQETKTNKTVVETKTVIPKWAWYSLGINGLIALYYFIRYVLPAIIKYGKYIAI